MAIFIVTIFKELSAFWLRIFNRWHSALKVAESNTIHLVSINKLVHSLYWSKKNQKLLKIQIFKMAKPPP